MAAQESTRLNVIFFHPDLGIGGAERLVVDAAVGLQELGHKVIIFTSYCDPNHCFEEARDGTLDVRVRGNALFPPSFLGRFHILLATLRQIHLVLHISIFTNELRLLKPSTFIVDQLSASLPLLRWLWFKQRILFYCHFPDQLLARRDQRGLIGFTKSIYRHIFDWFEIWTMKASDSVVVNSKFTKSVVIETLGKEIGQESKVIYPCVDTEERSEKIDNLPIWKDKKMFLSINRFEEKKGIDLAIRAFRGLADVERDGCRLVIAGGYDPRVAENVKYLKHLEALADTLGLETATASSLPTALAIPTTIPIIFLLSIPSSFKNSLLRSANLLLYTPQMEHFGVVPLEAMHAGVPVLAANTGGPLETIVEGKTGWLRDTKDTNAWTEILRLFSAGVPPGQFSAMGLAGQARVKELFSRKVMARRFEEELQIISAMKERKYFLEYYDVAMFLALAGAFLAALIATIVKGRK